MKNKMISRILGALSSALIIVAVFVPFVSVAGNSASLWNLYEDSIYLPIVIIVFGAMGVIFFALDKKTEFAYMSTGAVLFFVIMNAVDAMNNQAFDKLGIGFYFLLAGAILTGIMAFIHNIKPKKDKVSEVTQNVQSQSSQLGQVDDLYNPQPIQQPIRNVVEPILPINSVNEPVQPVQPVQPVNQFNIPIQQPVQPTNTINTSTQSFNQTSDYLKPIPDVVPVQPVQTPQGENPVLAENISNEVIEELKQGPHIDYAANDIFSPKVNPVVQEFANPAPQAPLESAAPQTDIFGQPINK